MKKVITQDCPGVPVWLLPENILQFQYAVKRFCITSPVGPLFTLFLTEVSENGNCFGSRRTACGREWPTKETGFGEPFCLLWSKIPVVFSKEDTVAAKKINKSKNSLRVIFFNACRIDSSCSPAIPEFSYHSQKHSGQTLPVLEPVKQSSAIFKHVLTQLHPLARNLFDNPENDNTAMTRVHEKLMEELKKSVWQCPAPTWATGKRKIKNLLFAETLPGENKEQYFFRFSLRKAGSIRLEGAMVFFYLVVEPGFPRGIEPSAEQTGGMARMMTNSLCYRAGLSSTAGRAARLTRVFPDQNRAAPRQEHLRRQFKGNKLPLIGGLLGETVTLEEIFTSLAGPEMKAVDGDRFLSQSLLVTPEDIEQPDFTEEEQVDLVRLARGQSDRYLPAAVRPRSDFVVPVRTFANVLFMAAGEGLACRVKPGRDQEFLVAEFRNRYESIYLLLFVLAMYQRYRLESLALELDGLFATLDSGEPDEKTVERMRRTRTSTAGHALRVMNTQPAFLTNYREVYQGLQRAFGIRELEKKVRRSVTELDYLLGDQYRRQQEKERKKFDTAKVILAMAAECIALPYYLYSLLAHLNGHITWWALFVTVLVTGAVVSLTWINIPGKIRKKIKKYWMCRMMMCRDRMNNNNSKSGF